MKTMIDLPDEIFRNAQEQATRLGMDVNRFIVAAIAREVASPMEGNTLPLRGPRSELPIIKGRGTDRIANVTSDLAARTEEEEDLAGYNRSFRR